MPVRNTLCLAALTLALAGCMARWQPQATPAPTGLTSSRGGGDQTLGNVAPSGPLRTIRTQ